MEDGRIAEEVAIFAPDGYGQLLFGQLGALLKRLEVPVTAIDCFATARGPGSFTGVRVGLAAMKGLAFATSKPVCAIPNLEAIASLGSAPMRAAFIDARRQQIFAAIYDEHLNVVSPEVVTSLPQWLSGIGDRDIEFLSTDLTGYDLGSRPAKSVGNCLAGVIGQLSYRRFTNGLAQHPSELDANYVRRADAELFWEDK